MFLIKTLSQTLFICLCFISTANAADSLQIENAWSPEAPPVAKVMAGYMKINNLSNKDIKILSAKSDLFKRVEIHLTEMSDGMMRMIKQENLKIKAKGHIELKPGGLHMML
ncbi:MAG: copper chaperone PCu(A)C, partial [Gammaproteobacteria bacterium]|nr:copper chaperone PCu(A)C [Gammaproteobacteria bacterium]